MQNALDNALLYTAAKFNVDDILTRDVAGFQEAVQQRVSELVEEEKLGIVIDSCEVQSIPPRQLQAVFAEVTTARENRNKLLNDAHSYENQVLNQSGAQATSITNAAASRTVRYVESITAEAKRFAKLLPQYQIQFQSVRADDFCARRWARCLRMCRTKSICRSAPMANRANLGYS